MAYVDPTDKAPKDHTIDIFQHPTPTSATTPPNVGVVPQRMMTDAEIDAQTDKMKKAGMSDAEIARTIESQRNAPRTTDVAGVATPDERTRHGRDHRMDGQQPPLGAARPGGDPNALIAQWQQSHKATDPDLPGLVQLLAQNGIQAQHTHADQITIGDGVYHLGSGLGKEGGSWFDRPTKQK